MELMVDKRSPVQNSIQNFFFILEKDDLHANAHLKIEVEEG